MTRAVHESTHAEDDGEQNRLRATAAGGAWQATREPVLAGA